MHIIWWLLTFVGLHSSTVVASLPIAAPETVITATSTEEALQTPTPDQKLFVRGLIDKYAKQYSVDPNVMWQVINCECPSLESDCPSGIIRKDGTEEPSFGLAQIYRTAHPEILYKDVIDPNFAINFMASYMAIGRFSMWSCYTILKNRGTL